MQACDRRVPFGDALYFQGYDDAHGSELWQSDGSPAGTPMVANLAPDTPQPLGSNPDIHAATRTEDSFGENNWGMVALGGALLPTADFDGAGRKLWVLHPTP